MVKKLDLDEMSIVDFYTIKNWLFKDMKPYCYKEFVRLGVEVENVWKIWDK